MSGTEAGAGVLSSGQPRASSDMTVRRPMVGGRLRTVARTRRGKGAGAARAVKTASRRASSDAGRTKAGGELLKAVQGLVKALSVGDLEKRLAGLEKSVDRIDRELRKALAQVAASMRSGGAGRARTRRGEAADAGSAKRTTAKRTTAKRTTAKRTTAKRTTAKRTTARRAAPAAAVKRTAAKRSAGGRPILGRPPGPPVIRGPRPPAPAP